MLTGAFLQQWMEKDQWKELETLSRVLVDTAEDFASDAEKACSNTKVLYISKKTISEVEKEFAGSMERMNHTTSPTSAELIPSTGNPQQFAQVCYPSLFQWIPWAHDLWQSCHL